MFETSYEITQLESRIKQMEKSRSLAEMQQNRARVAAINGILAGYETKLKQLKSARGAA